MKRYTTLILIGLGLGILESAYFLGDQATLLSVVFSYITLASIATALLVGGFYNRLPSVLSASLAAFVVGALCFNLAGLLFDSERIPLILEALMVLGGATGILLGLVQLRTRVRMSRA